MNIHFEKANLNHLDIIFGWLTEPICSRILGQHKRHKDDILNFVIGRKDLGLL